MEVLGRDSGGTEAVALTREHHPDVVLMDVRIPVQDGTEAARQIKQDDGTAEVKVLILTERYGMGVLVWSPLAQGLLTGRVRKGQETDLRRTKMFRHMRDERRLDAVEQIIPVAEQAGLKLTHMAVAFAISHPGVTSAIIGRHHAHRRRRLGQDDPRGGDAPGPTASARRYLYELLTGCALSTAPPPYRLSPGSLGSYSDFVLGMPASLTTSLH